MSHLSTIRAFQSVLSNYSFSEPLDFPEEFAIRRFQKKFQRPDPTVTDLLKAKAWEDWLLYDQDLSRVTKGGFVSFPVLYKVRESLKDLFLKLDSYDFPKGSEFLATKGFNSVESRLRRSKWTCTYDNFELFARFVYNCKAMKRAFRQRYNRWYQQQSFVESQQFSDKLIYRRFCSYLSSGNAKFASFKWKLERITDFSQGSRFSTVPKNNSVRRPINIECLGNIVVQRQIGNSLRKSLKEKYLVDLDVLAYEHSRKIRNSEYATIDLKNASDSVTLTLCEFLLPKSVYSLLLKSRSEFILGPDKAFHQIKKISSMGNGFTFELMTLILTAIARQFDPSATVFGDDIIIRNEFAQDLIDVLNGVGFHVNIDKSFIYSKFRESCGSNFHDDFGYIESYDFLWPETIHDCIVIYNKIRRLSLSCKSFETLRTKLLRHVPSALQGPIPFSESDFWKYRSDGDTPVELSSFFRTHQHSLLKSVRSPDLDRKRYAYALRYGYDVKDLKYFNGVRYIEKLASHTLKHLEPSKNWAKYEMYLYSNRRSKDVITGSGDWDKCLFLSVAGAAFRWTDSALE